MNCNGVLTFRCLNEQGIRSKVISWEFLNSDDFMQLAIHPAVPVAKLLEVTETYLLNAGMKFKMSAVVEMITEQFWKARSLPSQQALFDPAVAMMLFRHGIRLPMQLRGECRVPNCSLTR